MNFEDELKAALQREPAPADLAADLLAKTTESKTRARPFWRRPVTLAIAAAFALTAIVPSAVYQYRQYRRAIEARDQLILALSVTRVQLQQVREKINRNTRHKI
jgi:negative regulator of sigma E activity